MSHDIWIEFDGFDDYIDAGQNVEAHQIKRDITLEASVYAEPYAGDGRTMGIITKLYVDAGNEAGYGLFVVDGRLIFALNGGPGMSFAATTGPEGLPSGAWHHVAATYDGTVMSIYVDGVEQTQSPIVSPFDLAYSPDPNLYIGRYLAGPAPANQGFFRGKIRDVSLWDVARGASDFQDALNRTLTGSEGHLRASWALNEGQGFTVTDACTNTTALIQGAAKWGGAVAVEAPPAPAAEPPAPAAEPPAPAAGPPAPASPPPAAPTPPSPVPAITPLPPGALGGVLDTSAVLTTALGRLNRTSAVSLLQQLGTAIQAQRSSFDAKLASEFGNMATQFNDTIVGISNTTAANAAAIADLTQKLAALSQAQSGAGGAAVSAEDLANAVNAQLVVQSPQMVASAVSQVMQSVDQRFSQFTAENLDNVAKKVGQLKSQLDLVEAAASSLDANELQQVQTLLINVLSTIDLSSVLATALINVNGKPTALDALLRTLAARPNVASVQMIFSDDEITGAIFTLDTGKNVVFTAKRTDALDAITYAFTTANLNNLSAQFEIRFRRKAFETTIAGQGVSLEQYDSVYQSNVLYVLG